MSVLGSVASVVVGGLTSLLVSLLFHAVSMPVPIAYVDLSRVTTPIVSQISAQPDDPARTQRLIQGYSRELSHALSLLGHRYHSVIVPKTMVMTGGKDLTGALIKILRSWQSHDKK